MQISVESYQDIRDLKHVLVGVREGDGDLDRVAHRRPHGRVGLHLVGQHVLRPPFQLRLHLDLPVEGGRREANSLRRWGLHVAVLVTPL